ncbi:hypothetical protein BLNAU_13395 [Blattamonas nauphoetae]|uniref:Uncharacterized protein n=1 Tax=Blattamonas nauphoetae TaxID=2049346 RepID=A0ABQ9XN25_9EUKA|nr:hypothetical protein BLNAU_13395 [Blattamonas nauphoetae]
MKKPAKWAAADDRDHADGVDGAKFEWKLKSGVTVMVSGGVMCAAHGIHILLSALPSTQVGGGSVEIRLAMRQSAIVSISFPVRVSIHLFLLLHESLNGFLPETTDRTGFGAELLAFCHHLVSSGRVSRDWLVTMKKNIRCLVHLNSGGRWAMWDRFGNLISSMQSIIKRAPVERTITKQSSNHKVHQSSPSID